MPSFSRNVCYAYLSSGVSGLLALASVPIGVRLLGVAGYGLFSIYGVLASYVALVDLGVTKNFVRLLAAEGSERGRSRHHQQVFALYLLFAGLLLLLLPLLLWVVPYRLFPVPAGEVGKLRWIVAAVVVEYLVGIPTVMRQLASVAAERFDLSGRFALASACCRFLLMLAAMLLWKDPAVTVIFVASRRFFELYLGRALLPRLPAEAFRPCFDLPAFRRILRGSAPLSIVQILQSLMNTLGALLVNRHFGLEALGMYRAVFDLANKVWFFSNGIGAVLFPAFARMLSLPEERGSLYRRLVLILESSSAGFSLLYLLGTLAAPPLLPALGINQPRSLDLFLLVLLAICANAHSNLGYAFLQAAGRYWVVAVSTSLSLLAMWVIYELLRRGAGVLAMGWGWVASQFLYALLTDALALSQGGLGRGVQVRLAAGKGALFGCSLVMAAGSVYALSPLLTVAAGGGIIGGAAVAALRFRETSRMRSADCAA